MAGQNPSPALRIIRGLLEKHTLEGRTVGTLFADGTDAGELKAVKDDVENAGGHPMLIALKIGAVPLSDGSTVKADAQLFGQPSATVDACAVVLSEAACKKLVREGAAVQWVMDAFGHLKALGHNAAAKPLLDKAGVEPDEGVTDLAGFVEAARKRYWDREATIAFRSAASAVIAIAASTFCSRTATVSEEASSFATSSNASSIRSPSSGPRH